MGNVKNKLGDTEIIDLRDMPIDKTWLARQVGMSRPNLYHSLKYGFTKENAIKVREAL